MELPVSGHVFSTYAPYEGWGTGSLTPQKDRTLNNKPESVIYGFISGEHRVACCPQDRTKIIVHIYALTEEENASGRIHNVSYHVGPFCGKAEYEEWRRGYITF